MKKIMLVLLAGLLVMGLAACQEKEPPVSGGDLTDEPGKVRIFNEGGDQVHSSGARYVRVDGELYTDTGEIITLARCGVMDGEITKTVAASFSARVPGTSPTRIARAFIVCSIEDSMLGMPAFVCSIVYCACFSASESERPESTFDCWMSTVFCCRLRLYLAIARRSCRVRSEI